MITLFCVRWRGEPPPLGVVGPGGAAVRLIEEGRLGAWVADHDGRRELEQVRAHDAVVRAALRSATPVPVRFGTILADDEEVRAALSEREAEFAEALERVAGKAEMGLRVRWRAGPSGAVQEGSAAASASAGGRAYLEERRRLLEVRRRRRSEAESLLDRVEGALGVERLESRRTVLPEPGVAGVMAHLVHRRAVALYRTGVERARPAFPLVELRVTGPWAPYSFV